MIIIVRESGKPDQTIQVVFPREVEEKYKSSQLLMERMSNGKYSACILPDSKGTYKMKVKR